MRRVAVIEADRTHWSDSVIAGLAERHEVVRLSVHSRLWHLGSQLLGESPAASLAAAVSVLATADLAMPLSGDPNLAALCALAGVPVAGSRPAAIMLGHNWWATRLAAQDAGLDVAPGVRVSRSLARGLDYLDPVEVRPATRGPVPGRTHVACATEFPLALERAFTYADHAVVEQALDGERVTVAVLRRADGAALVSPPYLERPAAGAATPSWTGEIPVGAGRPFGGGGRTGARPPHTGPGPDLGRPGSGMPVGTGRGSAVTVAQLDPIQRRRIDHDALTLLTALGATGAMTVTFTLGARAAVLDDVDLAPALGRRDAVPRLFAAAGTSYPALLDALVETAR